MTTLAEKIAVMQAADRGEKLQAAPVFGPHHDKWEDISTPPDWNWAAWKWRVKPREPRRCWRVFNAGGYCYGTWEDRSQAKGFADAHGVELVEYAEVIKP